MNRFPIAWVVRVAVPETRRLSGARFAALLAALRAAPIDPITLRRQGWILAAALVVPFVVTVAIPVLVTAVRSEDPPAFASLMAVAAPLLIVSIYGSSCLFSLLNALVSSSVIRERLRSVTGVTPTV